MYLTQTISRGFTMLRVIMCILIFWPMYEHAGYSYFNHRHHDEHIFGYTLVDLGPCQLQDANDNHSLRPQINNNGLVIFNDKSGGFVWDKTHGLQRFPGDEKAFFHSINKEGTILVSRPSKKGPTEWMFWPEKRGLRQDPFVLALP